MHYDWSKVQTCYYPASSSVVSVITLLNNVCNVPPLVGAHGGGEGWLAMSSPMSKSNLHPWWWLGSNRFPTLPGVCPCELWSITSPLVCSPRSSNRLTLISFTAANLTLLSGCSPTSPGNSEHLGSVVVYITSFSPGQATKTRWLAC